MVTFGKRLKELRQNRHLKGQEVAKILGIATSTYVSYENRNSQPAFTVLCDIANLFDVSIDYLLGRKKSQFENIKVAGYTVKEAEGQ